MINVCITGASGNLGSLTAQHMMSFSKLNLNLMVHRKDISYKINDPERIKVFKCDLGDCDSLDACLNGVDVIVHYAGVLFKANPEKFLVTTNTKYFENLLIASKRNNVKRIILISFPHVEGPTSVNQPSTNKLDCTPISMHAKTRLQEEKLLIQYYPESTILRVGMVYGNGILMPDAARWFAKYWLLGVWKEPTFIHLISKVDFLDCVTNAVIGEHVSGTYNIGDDGIQTLQDYLKLACKYWKVKEPWIMPSWLIMFAASMFEIISKILGVASPLTKDFIKIGQVSYYGDTARMKKDLLPALRYRTMLEGIETF